MSAWVAIDQARVAADLLWPAELSLDMMGEDWSVFTVPVDADLQGLANFNSSDSGIVSKTLVSFFCGFPDSWDADDQYIVALRLSLVVPYTRGGPNPQPATIQIASGDAGVVIGASGSPTITRTWEMGALPTGPTQLVVSITADCDLDPGESFNVTATRVFGGRGADCFYQFVLSSPT